MSYEKFKLLDKVVHEFVNYDKPYEYPKFDIPFGCSGAAPMPLPNDKVEGIIHRIDVTKSLRYNFSTPDDCYEDECLPIGEYETEEKHYYILGYNKPLKDWQIKKI